MYRTDSQVILVIDDNSAVLSMTDAMLTRHGYSSIASLSGAQAIELLEGWPEVEVHLALIDVVLDDMSGPDVCKEVRRIRPGLPVIFMTGFPEHRDFLAAQGEPVLRKPFTSLALIQKILEMLGEPPRVSTTASSS